VRAAIYYHFAKFVFVHDQKQMRDAHLRSSNATRRRFAYAPAGERVSIPFEEKPPGSAATGGATGRRRY